MTPKIQSCHSPKMPAVAMMPVTSSGVSAANCVAAMLRAGLPPRQGPAREEVLVEVLRGLPAVADARADRVGDEGQHDEGVDRMHASILPRPARSGQARPRSWDRTTHTAAAGGVASGEIDLEAQVLLEGEPLPVGPVPPMVPGLGGQLRPVGAGVHRRRLARGGPRHPARVPRRRRRSPRGWEAAPGRTRRRSLVSIDHGAILRAIGRRPATIRQAWCRSGDRPAAANASAPAAGGRPAVTI